jgi:hypothetical protein
MLHFNGLHSVISQTWEIFISIAVRSHHQYWLEVRAHLQALPVFTSAYPTLSPQKCVSDPEAWTVWWNSVSLPSPGLDNADVKVARIVMQAVHWPRNQYLAQPTALLSCIREVRGSYLRQDTERYWSRIFVLFLTTSRPMSRQCLQTGYPAALISILIPLH